MTREQALAELRALVAEGAADPEVSHTLADNVIVKLLESLGYHDVVAEWSKVAKWYA